MASPNKKSTELVELVETHNIMKSINRIKSSRYGCDDSVARALYHAICMTYTFGMAQRQELRIAMRLP